MNNYSFAWHGASHPNGPWAHLRVVELHGRETLSKPYSFVIDLAQLEGEGDPVSISDLLGKAGALLVRVEQADGSTSHRIVHGVIAGAEEVGEIARGVHFQVELVPPFHRATLMQRSAVFVDRTLKEIIEQVLTRSDGARLVPSDGAPPQAESDDGGLPAYAEPRCTFAWRIRATAVLAHREHCVQYNETDFDFVSRLLEELGISYHFEHSPSECRLVFSDEDECRMQVDQPLGDGRLHREVLRFRAGGRMRPLTVEALDYDWQRPQADMHAVVAPRGSDFSTMEYPGGFARSKEDGEKVAEVRLQRLDVEREWFSGVGRYRQLSAGSVFKLEHPKFEGTYLVTSVEHIGYEHESFSDAHHEHPYENRFHVVRADRESGFRPARSTQRPRIVGSQTAIVTAEVKNTDIPVGGDADLGCVRLRFRWDVDAKRLAEEPSSGWFRVGQMFAGATDHGALFNPRVDEEVIVDFLDGDPDRPIVTGRVYNGVRRAILNATQDPTTSGFRSATVPADGTYNELLFKDAAGQQEIVIRSSKDMHVTAKHDGSRAVGNNDKTTVAGDQSVKVSGTQATNAGKITMDSDSTVAISAASDMSESAGANMHLRAGANMDAFAGAKITMGAGSKFEAAAPDIHLAASGLVHVDAPVVTVKAAGMFSVDAPNANVHGQMVIIIGDGVVLISGAVVNVSGGTVNVTAKGDVNVKGGTINLNS